MADDEVTAYLDEVRGKVTELARAKAADPPRGQVIAPSGPTGDWVIACIDLAHEGPRLLKALEAVRSIHRPQEVYALSVMGGDHGNPPRVLCGHAYEETGNDRHEMADGDSIVCLDKHEGTVCAECWWEGGEQADWPCLTYRDMTAALTGEDGTE